MKGAMFIGWGEIFPGYREKALKVFSEALQFWGGLLKKGDIDSFDPVFLDYHGGDLTGFILVRGDREKLMKLRGSSDFERLNTRSALVVANFGVVDAFVGEEIQHRTSEFQKQLSDLD